MKKRHDVTFTIVLRSPFIMAGIDASGVGIDTPALRDEESRPIIPGDHLKGLLREAIRTLEHFAESSLNQLKPARFFGEKSAFEAGQSTVANPFEPQRGDLLIRDLTAQTACKERDITRIAIDSTTGAVKTGFLQVVELVAPLGATVIFSGVSLFYGTEEEAKDLESLLNKAIKLIPYFGGLRTSGFGEHVAENSSVTVRAAVSSGQTLPVGDYLSVDAELDRAFLIAADRVADNVYVGSSVIPGGAIKGALADMLQRRGLNPSESPLSQTLAALSISHARPFDNAELQDRALPLSLMMLATGGKHLFVDALGIGGNAGLIQDEEGKWVCADFQPDWKEAYFDKARALFGRKSSDLSKLTRGHTAIEAENGTAKKKSLFLEVLRGHLVEEENTDPSAKKRLIPLTFRFTIDLSAARQIDQKSVNEIIKCLEGGIDAIGKTHASMTMKFTPVTQGAAVPPTDSEGRWRLMLETPAPMLEPDGPYGFKYVSDTLMEYFKTVIPGSLLIDHFCQRKLHGGYASRRRKLYSNYQPTTLYDAGSCFLLEAEKGKEQAVGERLAELQRTGLPHLIKKDDRLELVTDWRRSAWLPQNGYGAISITNSPWNGQIP